MVTAILKFFLRCFRYVLVFIQVSGEHRKTFIKQNRNIPLIIAHTALLSGYFFKGIPFSRSYSKDFLNQILAEKPFRYTGSILLESVYLYKSITRTLIF